MITYKVGSNIDSWCTKCRLILAHTIAVLEHDKPKKVTCNTCKGTHLFRANAPGTSNKVKTTKSPKKLNIAKFNSVEFEEFIAQKDLSKVIPYSPKYHYAKDDIISHEKFGLGIVLEHRDLNKVEILFKYGAKVLIHSKL